MKKARKVICYIEMVLGFILLVSSQIAIEANSRYTWTKPYTEFEAQVLLRKWIGLILLIWGAIDCFLLIIMKRYKDNNIKDVNTYQASTVKTCPICGISVNASVNKCPKCGNEFK